MLEILKIEITRPRCIMSVTVEWADIVYFWLTLKCCFNNVLNMINSFRRNRYFHMFRASKERIQKMSGQSQKNNLLDKRCGFFVIYLTFNIHTICLDIRSKQPVTMYTI